MINRKTLNTNTLLALRRMHQSPYKLNKNQIKQLQEDSGQQTKPSNPQLYILLTDEDAKDQLIRKNSLSSKANSRNKSPAIMQCNIKGVPYFKKHNKPSLKLHRRQETIERSQNRAETLENSQRDWLCVRQLPTSHTNSRPKINTQILQSSKDTLQSEGSSPKPSNKSNNSRKLLAAKNRKVMQHLQRVNKKGITLDYEQYNRNSAVLRIDDQEPFMGLAPETAATQSHYRTSYSCLMDRQVHSRSHYGPYGCNQSMIIKKSRKCKELIRNSEELYTNNFGDILRTKKISLPIKASVRPQTAPKLRYGMGIKTRGKAKSEHFAVSAWQSPGDPDERQAFF